ncbi:MAG: beta-N-acetylhexosaminidase [Saprospiraceae bacterium]|nr:beta-N-acetylhexosaminidase [Saprospiraceae bacterium]
MNQPPEKQITGSFTVIQSDNHTGQNPVTHGWIITAAVVILWQVFLIPGSAQIPVGCDLPLFPFPASCSLEGGLTTATRWAWSPESVRFLPKLSEYSRHDSSPLPSVAPGSEGTIHLFLDTISIQHPESYLLVIDARNISITASSSTGFLHGLRTLAQLRQADGAYPRLRIADQPRFAYRGMHLDVSRHFFPVTFIKRYLDLLARYKFNTFHWHLTDDQGWRLEIKSFPKLTEIGAWRNGSQQGPYARMAFDTVRYGGYYSQDEVRDIVAYAFERGITIIPEIEMPGHAIAALAAYPEYSCSGGPFSVERGWGVFEDVFCTREETFLFLEKVLNEVMDLFPSPYIHIGGDECPRTRWHSCPQCQQRMASEGLRNEDELQAYFTRRIQQMASRRGRKIIGWDEILEEGGLPSQAAVMSWRGADGGIEAAKSGHAVVMTPGSHCYFDHYQGDPAFEPVAIGGHTPLLKVYDYEPVPHGLTTEEERFILGAQGNVWTEYMTDESHVEYMVLPRMIALAEVLWSPPTTRDADRFLKHLEGELTRLEHSGYTVSRSHQQVSLHTDQGPSEGTLLIRATTPEADQQVEMIWTPEGDTANRQIAFHQMVVSGSGEVTARLLLANHPAANQLPVSRKIIHHNLATGKAISSSLPPVDPYQAGGIFSLVNGIQAGDMPAGREWLGWRSDVAIDLDLGRPLSFRAIKVGALHMPHSWIHRPVSLEVWISTDGIHFEKWGQCDAREVLNDEQSGGRLVYRINGEGYARFVRLQVQSKGIIPSGWPGAGHPAWTFLDEWAME